MKQESFRKNVLGCDHELKSVSQSVNLVDCREVKGGDKPVKRNCENQRTSLYFVDFLCLGS